MISSVSDDVKVVDMWRYWDSKNHNHSADESDEMRLPWLSEGLKKMYDTLRGIEDFIMSLGSYIELRLRTIRGNPKIKKSKKVKKKETK